MTTTYNIEVINKSSDLTNYLLFCDVPEATNNIGKAWTSIYGKTPVVGAGGGITSMNITDENFAVCRMAEMGLGPGVRVSTAESIPVKLGPDQYGAVSMAIEDDGLVFVGDVAKTSIQGGYEMKTMVWPNAKYSQAFCGYGKIQPNKMPATVIPVATWTARSAQSYKVYPKAIYYVSIGYYEPGDIVDKADFAGVATVDFTGRDETSVTVTQTRDGTYEPTQYSHDA